MHASSAIESNNLPAWQTSLVQQICNVLKNYYGLPDKFNENEFRKFLIDNLVRLNSEFPQFKTLDQIKLTFDPDALSIGQQPLPPPKIKMEFIVEINKVLKEFDSHLRLIYDPVHIQEDIRKNKILIDEKKQCARFNKHKVEPDQLAEVLDSFKKDNYGFTDQPFTELYHSIPKDIGYVRIKYFVDPTIDEDEKQKVGVPRQKATDVMQKLQGKKAIIIDLRDSMGGSPEMVEHIISFLLQENGTTINTIFNRIMDETKEYKVQPTQFKLSNIPIFVLVNNNTFSASEEFAYDLQQLNKHVLKNKRFTIIGQPTGGGAHPGGIFPLLDTTTGQVNNEFVLWLSTSNAINPYSKTNWEDQPIKGVQPDIRIKENEDALVIAERWARSGISHGKSDLLKANQLLRQPGRESIKNKGVDVTDDEMTTHAFGKGSSTAKKLLNK